jgi:hypothetical protein
VGDNPWQPGPAEVIAVALVGAGFGFGVLYVDWPFPDDAAAFTSTGEYGLWLFLLCAMTALWALALLPLAASLRIVWQFGEGNWGRVIVSTASLAVVLLLIAVGSRFVSTSFPEINYPLPSHGAKLMVIAGVGSVIAIAGGLGMALVHAGLVRVARDDLSSEAARDRAIPNLFLLREQLERLLAIEGAILGAAILQVAALRNAVLAYGQKSEAEPTSFPPEYVLVYGAAFSILLALVWAPIYSLLIAAGARVRDAATKRAENESWLDWHERRTRFEDLVGFQSTPSASFRSGVAILTPLASSLLGLLFGT